MEAAKPPAQRVPRPGLALQQAQGVLDRVDQRPAQLEQLAAGTPGEDKPRQRSAGSRPAFRQLSAKLRESDRLATPDLGQTRIQGGEGVGVG
jgi:hypothetical protein